MVADHEISRYNTLQQLRFYIVLLTVDLSSEVHLHVDLHASAAQMQWYCRAIVCEEFAQRPYTVDLTVSDEPRTRTLGVTGRTL